MSDITDGQNITDDAVAVAVNVIDILLDVLFYHGTLKFSTLIGVESYVIGIFVIVQSCHIKLSCGAAGRLAVKPYQRFILVFHLCVGVFCLCRSHCCLSRCRCRRFCCRSCGGLCCLGATSCHGKYHCGCHAYCCYFVK